MNAAVLGGILIVLWLIRTARAVSYQIAVWQQKEYRLDRMRAHLSLNSAKRQLFSPWGSTKLGLLALLLIFPRFSFYAGTALLLSYAVEVINFAREFAHRTVQRPKLTIKASLLLGINFVVIASLPFFLAGWSINPDSYLLVLGILAADRLVIPVAALSVALLYPLSSFGKGLIIRKAKRARAANESVKVIGITGSYGKSSTKRILNKILAPQGETAATVNNTNTEIGVAKSIISQLKNTTEYFVVEMGAYRAGEIKKIAELAEPRVGIITAVTDQHLALFGSKEEIKRAKYELIESLPADGTAVFNIDDPAARSLAAKTEHCGVVTYGLEKEADFRAEQITREREGLTFKLIAPAGTITARSKLIGEEQVSNILAAVAAASQLGVSLEDAAAEITRIKPRLCTMQPLYLRDNTYVIDDSYSANPAGVIAALNTLAKTERAKKTVIFRPMIELGGEAGQAHRRVGKKLAQTAGKVFYTGTDYAENLKKGMAEAGVSQPDFLEIEEDPQKLYKKLAPYRGQDAVVLLEGRIPGRLREMIVRDKQQL